MWGDDERDDSANDIGAEHLQAFLEELTLLSRKYKLIVSSEGSRDIPSVRKISFEEANSSRYTCFWKHSEERPKDPEEIFWTPDAALENVVHFDEE